MSMASFEEFEDGVGLGVSDLRHILQALGPEEALGNYKAAELRAYCKRFGLKSSGCKVEVIRALAEYVRKTGPQASMLADVVPSKEQLVTTLVAADAQCSSERKSISTCDAHSVSQNGALGSRDVAKRSLKRKSSATTVQKYRHTEVKSSETNQEADIATDGKSLKSGMFCLSIDSKRLLHVNSASRPRSTQRQLSVEAIAVLVAKANSDQKPIGTSVAQSSSKYGCSHIADIRAQSLKQKSSTTEVDGDMHANITSSEPHDEVMLATDCKSLVPGPSEDANEHDTYEFGKSHQDSVLACASPSRITSTRKSREAAIAAKVGVDQNCFKARPVLHNGPSSVESFKRNTSTTKAEEDRPAKTRLDDATPPNDKRRAPETSTHASVMSCASPFRTQWRRQSVKKANADAVSKTRVKHKSSLAHLPFAVRSLKGKAPVTTVQEHSHAIVESNMDMTSHEKPSTSGIVTENTFGNRFEGATTVTCSDLEASESDTLSNHKIEVEIRLAFSGLAIAQLLVRPEDTVHTLKSVVSTLRTWPPGAQQLLYDGKVLQDSATVSSSGLHDGSILSVLCESLHWHKKVKGPHAEISDDGLIVRRREGHHKFSGALVIANGPSRSFRFKVIDNSARFAGGVELGFSCVPPQALDDEFPQSAVSMRHAYICDCHGELHAYKGAFHALDIDFDEQRWDPEVLRTDDVVECRATSSGQFQIEINGCRVADWDAAIPTADLLYPVVGVFGKMISIKLIQTSGLDQSQIDGH